MSAELMSPTAFRWLVTLLTVGACLWALYDVVKMAKARYKDGSDPLVRDERFGYWIGIAIAVFGLVGMLRYHGVI